MNNTNTSNRSNTGDVGATGSRRPGRVCGFKQCSRSGNVGETGGGLTGTVTAGPSLPGEPLPLAGRVVALTADRRRTEQAGLFRRRGATVVEGPTLRTVDLSSDLRLRQVTDALIAHPPDVLVVTTGLGLSLWLETAASWGASERLAAALGRARSLARGAKAASALRRAGLGVAWQAPAETMDDVLAYLAEEAGAGARVALQLFDPADHPSTRAARALGLDVVEVPVYRWLLPDDLAPAEALVQAAVAGELDAVTFTSQPAARHLFAIAAGAGQDQALRRAFNEGLCCACVGPVCAAAAREMGVAGPVWPTPPRLVAMARLVAETLSPTDRRPSTDPKPST